MADVRTLPDAETIAEAPPSPTHATIRREDYRPPDWLVPEIALRFTLDLEKTRVQAKLNVERNTAASQDAARFGSTATSLSRSACGSMASCRMTGRCKAATC